jgi:hypothetical protein
MVRNQVFRVSLHIDMYLQPVPLDGLDKVCSSREQRLNNQNLRFPTRSSLSGTNPLSAILGCDVTSCNGRCSGKLSCCRPTFDNTRGTFRFSLSDSPEAAQSIRPSRRGKGTASDLPIRRRVTAFEANGRVYIVLGRWHGFASGGPGRSVAKALSDDFYDHPIHSFDGVAHIKFGDAGCHHRLPVCADIEEAAIYEQEVCRSSNDWDDLPRVRGVRVHLVRDYRSREEWIATRAVAGRVR